MLHRTLLTVTIVLLLAAPASAREGAPDVQQFKPVTDVQGFVLLHDATQLNQFRPAFSLTLNYGVNPLEVNAPGYGRQFGIVDGIFGVDLTGAFGLFDWWEVALHFPVAQIPLETDFITNVGGKKVAYGIGDIRLETRLQALDPSKFPVGLSGSLFLTVPSGSERAGLGRGLPGGGVRVALSQSWTRVHFAVNVGYVFYPRATIANLTTGDEITLGGGIGFTPIIDKLNVRLELDGSFNAGPNDDGDERFGDPAHTPFEVLGSVEYKFPFGLALRGGLGKGITPGFGATDFRFFVGASYAIFKPIDRDKDGIADPDDACKKEPEDMDGWEDSDGCPDPDNDGDGMADVADQCPDEAEDADGWEDADGCPDPDNDGDGIDDGVDTCPEEPEDLDGFQDVDGCIDPDNDGDGIADMSDACPNAAETVDGWQDEDGCPDDKLAVVTEGQIAILQPILFRSGSAKIEKESMSIVTTVAKIMTEHQSILQVRIEGHTDNKGNPDSNLRLSERRAETVMKELIKLGIDRSRLESAGYGDSRPVGSNRTEDGRTKNRRIEFRILAQAATEAQVQNPSNIWGEVKPPETEGVPEPPPVTKPELTPVPNPWD